MGRYGAYAPHTVEYHIYRGEATDNCVLSLGRGVKGTPVNQWVTPVLILRKYIMQI